MKPTPPRNSAPTARAFPSSDATDAAPPVKTFRCRVAGTVAGTVNGIFGGGGGIPLLVLLTRWAKVEEKTAFATCVAVILPVCAVSAAMYWLEGSLSLGQALPYLIGGLAGGAAGGLLFRRVPGVWLRRLFALFLLYGAWRYLT